MNKAIWKSKTFWGAVTALLAVIFPDAWASVGVGDDYSMLAGQIQGFIGGALAIYGRYAAGGVSITGK